MKIEARRAVILMIIISAVMLFINAVFVGFVPFAAFILIPLNVYAGLVFAKLFFIVVKEPTP